MHIQELILRLQRFWADRGCLIGQPYDLEKGAGTMNPLTFFGALGPKPWNVAYVEPSRRPADGRYGENPFRVYKHLQFQVILKPSPRPRCRTSTSKAWRPWAWTSRKHDLRFEEDNWEAPTLGAWGVGWQVMLDGMEISQFTYFQQVGGMDCRPVSAEITYGIERICMFLGGYDNIFDLVQGEVKTDDGVFPVTYGQMRQREEFELSAYSFEHADLDLHWHLFDAFEKEGWHLLKDHGHFLSRLRAGPQDEPHLQRPGRPGRRDPPPSGPASSSGCGTSPAPAPGPAWHTRRAAARPPLAQGKEVRGMSATRTLLLEIHCEEIPARFLAPLTAEFTDGSGLHPGQPQVGPARASGFYSPRKLAWRIRAPAGGPARTRPRPRWARPSACAWTGRPAHPDRGLKFAEKWGVAFDQVRFEQPAGKKEPCAVVTLTSRAGPRWTCWRRPCPRLVAALHVPKAMRWGSSEFEFVRPIRNMLCLFGSEVVPFQLDGVAAGATTWGHRLYHLDHPGPVAVPRPRPTKRPWRRRAWWSACAERRARLARQLTPWPPSRRPRGGRRGAAGHPGGDRGVPAASSRRLPRSLPGPCPRRCWSPPWRSTRRPSAWRTRRASCCPASSPPPTARTIPRASSRAATSGCCGPGSTTPGSSSRRTASTPSGAPGKAQAPHLPAGAGQLLRQDPAHRRPRPRPWPRSLGAGRPPTGRWWPQACKCDLVTLMVGEFPELQGIMGGEYLRREGAHGRCGWP